MVKCAKILGATNGQNPSVFSVVGTEVKDVRMLMSNNVTFLKFELNGRVGFSNTLFLSIYDTIQLTDAWSLVTH